MAVIPAEIYRLVERRLRDRHLLVARAEFRLMEAQSAVANASAPPMDAGKVKTAPGNRTQKMALSVVEAEKALEEARQWLDAFRLTDAAFPFPGTEEGKVVHLLYEQQETQEEVCRIMQCERKAIRRRRDNYVTNAALIAASKGLITFEEAKE